MYIGVESMALKGLKVIWKIDLIMIINGFDYCNCLYCILPAYQLKKLQLIVGNISERENYPSPH